MYLTLTLPFRRRTFSRATRFSLNGTQMVPALSCWLRQRSINRARIIMARRRCTYLAPMGASIRGLTWVIRILKIIMLGEANKG